LKHDRKKEEEKRMKAKSKPKAPEKSYRKKKGGL